MKPTQLLSITCINPLPLSNNLYSLLIQSISHSLGSSIETPSYTLSSSIINCDVNVTNAPLPLYNGEKDNLQRKFDLLDLHLPTTSPLPLHATAHPSRALCVRLLSRIERRIIPFLCIHSVPNDCTLAICMQASPPHLSLCLSTHEHTCNNHLEAHALRSFSLLSSVFPSCLSLKLTVLSSFVSLSAPNGLCFCKTRSFPRNITNKKSTAEKNVAVQNDATDRFVV